MKKHIYTTADVERFSPSAEFGLNEIPKDALNINVEYDEEDLDIRYFTFSSESQNNNEFLEKLSKKVEE